MPMAAVQQYGQQIRLLTNQRYHITLQLPDADHTFSFTSRYAPYYCPTRIVQGDLGQVLNHVPIEDTAQMIWQMSLEIEDKLTEEGIDIENANQRAVQQYVRYRSNYMLLFSVFSMRNANAGQENRRLRDLTVQVMISKPDVDPLLDRWRRLAEEQLATLLNRTTIGRPFLKAGSSSFPQGRMMD